MRIEPIQKTETTVFGAIVTDVDLNHLSDEEWKVVEAAWYEHAVLVLSLIHI